MILEKLTILFTWGSLESGSNSFCVFTHTHTYTQVSCGWMMHSKTNSNLNLSAALHEASASEGCVEVRATLAQPAETSSIIGQIAANLYRVSVGGYDQPIEHFKNGNQEVL